MIVSIIQGIRRNLFTPIPTRFGLASTGSRIANKTTIYVRAIVIVPKPARFILKVRIAAPYVAYFLNCRWNLWLPFRRPEMRISKHWNGRLETKKIALKINAPGGSCLRMADDSCELNASFLVPICEYPSVDGEENCFTIVLRSTAAEHRIWPFCYRNCQNPEFCSFRAMGLHSISFTEMNELTFVSEYCSQYWTKPKAPEARAIWFAILDWIHVHTP